jgi:lysophospholipase L1-like esterase
MIVKLLKLVVINILVLMGLLIVLNFTAILLFQGRLFIKHSIIRDNIDKRARLPNYKNIDWASKNFKEEDELQSEYRSYIGWRRLPYKGETININEQGIRNTPQSELATEKSLLVVFLGGSTMWGTGSDDKNTIPALFANIAQGRYRAINLAESGYNAFQGYLFLQLQIIDGLRPNVVVCYGGVNDAPFFQSGQRPFSHSRENQIRAAMKGQDRDREDVLSFSNFFLNPLKSFINIFIVKKKPKYDFSQERTEQVAKALLESWLLTKDLAEKHGADFIAILQPNAAIGKPYLEYLKLDTDRLKCFSHFYPAVLKLLQSPKYQELSNNVIVLTDAFDQKEYIYIDECHVSPNGNKIIAAKIYDHISNSMKK